MMKMKAAMPMLAMLVVVVVVAMLMLLVVVGDVSTVHAAAAVASDAIEGVPAHLTSRVRALERAFGIGEVARRRALLAESSEEALGDTATCASGYTCSTCGDLDITQIGQVAYSAGGTNGDYLGFTVCGSSVFSSQGVSCDPGTIVCQIHYQSTAYVSYELATTANQPSWTLNSDGTLSYVQMGEQNTCQVGNNNYQRGANVTFTCGSANQITAVGSPNTQVNCIYPVTMTSPLVCGITPSTLNPANGGGSSGGGSKGLSGGWVFIIILIVFTSVYLIGGAALMHFKYGATTAGEHCPNSSFWKDLPSLIKDGCSFTWTRLRALRTGASYSTV